MGESVRLEAMRALHHRDRNGKVESAGCEVVGRVDEGWHISSAKGSVRVRQGCFALRWRQGCRLKSRSRKYSGKDAERTQSAVRPVTAPVGLVECQNIGKDEVRCKAT